MNLKTIRHILFRIILPHLTIVLSGMLIVLLLIDRINSSMMFIDHRITKGLMTVLAVASIVNGASLLTRPRHHAPEHSHSAEYGHPSGHEHSPHGYASNYTRAGGYGRSQDYGPSVHSSSDYGRVPEHTRRPEQPRPVNHSRPGSGRSWM